MDNLEGLKKSPIPQNEAVTTRIWLWPDPEKVDELKVEFCPIIRSRTNEEKSIQ